MSIFYDQNSSLFNTFVVIIFKHDYSKEHTQILW